MSEERAKRRADWQRPMLAGLVGVTLFWAGVLSRLTNPPSSLILSSALGGLGLLGLGFYLKSGARDREVRITASLSEEDRQRLGKQRPLSIALVIGLIALVGFTFGLSFFVSWIDPLFYNGVISFCLIGMVIWCVAAGFGLSARHTILDDHERAPPKDAGQTVR